MTSPSLCPHLVQEYFERVSDILTTYRPQILKQVEYDKISENLVLRGAVRPEEHEKIFQCPDLEGQTSQMLVVIQNRMWGLENLLASFMEEHISPWLTQQMFRAYMDHLVNPLKQQRDSQVCQCVQISNSILYRGWVKALKSLDSLILKTGTSLGFMRQSMYPQDNILAFLNEKLAEYTGGDSSSQEDLVPYGFAPNASGEVQVAELEEDDFNDLFSLSESLSIAYHANNANGGTQLSIEAAPTTPKEPDSQQDKQVSNCTAPQPTHNESNVTTSEAPKGRPPPNPNRRRRSTDSSNTNSSETPKASEKRLKQQQDLIARLSAPKSAKTSSSSSNTPVRLRHSNSVESAKLASKQRPRSAEFHRSTSASSTPSQSSPSSSTSTLSNVVTGSSSTVSKSDKATTTGKTTGFVRSKSAVPTSPKSRISKSSSKSKPTAVTKPNFKQGKISTDTEDNHDDAKRDSQSANIEVDDVTESQIPDGQAFHKRSVSESDYVPFDPEDNEYEDEIELPAGISNLLLTNPIFGSKMTEDGNTKNFDYYQLTHFDSDDD